MRHSRTRHSQVVEFVQREVGSEHVQQADHLRRETEQVEIIFCPSLFTNKKEEGEMTVLRVWNVAHIFMFHVFEQPQLSVRPLGKQLRLERPVQLLDGHFGSGSGVHCWAEGENVSAGVRRVRWISIYWLVVNY